MEETPDFSKILEQLQETLSEGDGQNLIQSLIGQLTASDNTDSSEQASSDSSPLPLSELLGGNEGLDFDTISKIASVMQAMNREQNNPKVAFLHALKPFLKKERRERLDKAAMLLKVSTVLKTFNKEGGA